MLNDATELLSTDTTGGLEFEKLQIVVFIFTPISVRVKQIKNEILKIS